MTKRVSFMLLLALVLTGCANLILPGSNRIWEERTASTATSHRSLVMSEPLDWFASENGDRYDIWLPQGAYHVEAEDSDYLYYKAPERVSLGKTKFFSTQDSRTYDGGIFISKSASSKYSSGAYIDYKDGKKLLLFCFDFRFTGQEGRRWHYEEYPPKDERKDSPLMSYFHSLIRDSPRADELDEKENFLLIFGYREPKLEWKGLVYKNAGWKECPPS